MAGGIRAAGNVDAEPRADHAFRQFVLKLHSRCDLACDYCYVYTKTDQRWVDRPGTMARQTIDAVGRRIAEHARTHRLPTVDIALHGGEPLLAGLGRIAALVGSLRDVIEVPVRISLQTNGVLLTESALQSLRALEVRVGVSLDGDESANDRHRRHRDGQGSYRSVAAALDRLKRPENRAVYAGIICTIDLANNPVTTYEALLRHAPPQINFLRPLGNWTNPPPGRPADPMVTEYADWLIAVFDRWYGAAHRETRIRYFEDLISVLFGGRPATIGVGVAPAASIIVETDGKIESCDLLTSTYAGAADTGLTVFDHSFDQALADPIVVERRAGLSALAATCRDCAVVKVCGGGLHAERYRAGTGFAHPSVYCADLFALITHVRGRVESDLRALRSARGSRG